MARGLPTYPAASRPATTRMNVDECLRLMKEAIAFHIEGMRQDGEPVPEPSTVAATVHTIAT